MASASQLGDGTGHIFVTDAAVTYGIVPIFINNAIGKRRVLEYLFPGSPVLATTVGNYRFWLDDSGTAVNGPPTGTDITPGLYDVFMRGLPRAVQSASDDGSGVLTIDRNGIDTFVEVDSTGVLASVSEIVMTDVQPGDTVTMWGKRNANGIRVGTGTNFYTVADANFDSIGSRQTITMIYLNDDLLGLGWFEAGRSAQHPITVQDLRNGQIPEPALNTTVQPLFPGGGVFTLVAGTDPGTVYINTGVPDILTGNNSFVGDLVTPIVNDKFVIYGNFKTVIYSGGMIMIETTPVPERLANTGAWMAEIIYNGSVWVPTIYADMTGSQIIQDSQIFDVDGAKIQAASIPAGKQVPGSLVGADMANGTIDLNKLSAGVQAAISAIGTPNTIVRSLSSADILTGNSVPVNLLGTAPTGFCYIHDKTIVNWNFITAPYATNTDFQIVATGDPTSVMCEITGGLAVATDRIMLATPTTGSAIITNTTGFDFYVPTGDPTAGSGTASITLIYLVVPL